MAPTATRAAEEEEDSEEEPEVEAGVLPPARLADPARLRARTEEEEDTRRVEPVEDSRRVAETLPRRGTKPTHQSKNSPHSIDSSRLRLDFPFST